MGISKKSVMDISTLRPTPPMVFSRNRRKGSVSARPGNSHRFVTSCKICPNPVSNFPVCGTGIVPLSSISSGSKCCIRRHSAVDHPLLAASQQKVPQKIRQPSWVLLILLISLHLLRVPLSIYFGIFLPRPAHDSNLFCQPGCRLRLPDRSFSGKA